MVGALTLLGVGDLSPVLEPGCGTGSLMEAARRSHLGAAFVGVEVDPLSARIAQALHPDASIVCAPLEECEISEGGFDAVVGNVPYSESILLDGPEGRRVPIHDYFILESLRAVRPGGVVCLLTSRYTLDKRTSTTRAALAAQADLLAALRLPKEAFREAGTAVVSDLLVFRKRVDRPLAALEGWQEVVEMGGCQVNALFAADPTRVLGEMSTVTGRFGATVDVTSGLSGEEMGIEVTHRLATQLAPFAHALGSAPLRPNPPSCHRRPASAPTFEYLAGEDGSVWYGDGEVVELVEGAGGDGRLHAMVSLRDLTRRTLALESTSENDDEVAVAISRLDAAYETFVDRYGRVCDRKNQRAWGVRSDYGIALVSALEITDPQRRFVAKADILARRVQSPTPPSPDHVESAQDALSVSLDLTGGVDLPLISDLLGCEREAALERLGDLVVMDPDDGRAVTASSYLSGNVVEKLAHVRELLETSDPARDPDALRAWAAELGLDTALELTDVARSARDILVETGAWETFLDPDAATTAVVAEAHFDAVDSWQFYRDLPLLCAEIVRSGAHPIGMSGSAGPSDLLCGMVERSLSRMWKDPSRAPRDLALLCLLASSPETAVDDRALGYVAALAIQGRRSGTVPAETLELLIPGCGARQALDYREGGQFPRYAKSRFDDGFEPCLVLARSIRRRPEAVEYLFALARDGSLASSATAEGLARFSELRSARLSALHEDRSPLSEEQLRRLAERLSACAPAPLTADEIAPSLGASWIPPRYVLDFVRERLGCPSPMSSESQRRHLAVTYSQHTGRWQVKASGVGEVSTAAQARFGTPEMSCLKILEAALNNATIRITRPSDERDGERVTDPQATAAAMACRSALSREFCEWVFEDAARRRALCSLYNRRVNTLAPRAFDGSYLTLPGHDPSIHLRAHQLDAVARALQSSEGTLIAHVVGAGKTFAGVAIAMEARRVGRARKPMFAVPNHLTEQWASDFLTLYPSAKVLYMTPQDTRGADSVRLFWARAAAGDWDAIIVGHSRFSQLRVSPERQASYLEGRIGELTRSIGESRANNGAKSFTVKQLESTRKRLRDKVKKLRATPPLQGATFESLGVDMLFVDEAHAFKNLAIETSLDVAGVTNAASSKCEDLLDKCTYLRERGHGSNIVFATGTPVSNTMSELYNLQRYLAPGLLEAQGCGTFAAWASTFGEIVDSVEVRPEGTGFQLKQRFARFRNLPELMASFHLFADIRTEEDLDLDVPECEKVNVQVAPSQSQRDLVARLAERAERVRNGSVPPEEDNLLKITGEGRKLALDPKLLAPDDPDVTPIEGGKVAACAERVHEIWLETEGTLGTQLVFCDTSTPASGTWNVYDDLKRRLVELGIPPEQVAFVSDAGDNPRRKEELFAKVNNGQVRVLLGSTQKLGTGTNVQRRLVATHDLDCPWRPSDLEQRLGRIVRQGNENERVRAFRYVTQGTFDSYLYQTVERKQRFVSQIFTSRNPVREAADLDEAVLDYGTIKALATGDPTVRRRMEIENEITQLELLRRAHATGREHLRHQLETVLAPSERSAREELSALEADLPALSRLAETLGSVGPGDFSLEVQGERHVGRKDCGNALVRAALNAPLAPSQETPTPVGELYGVTVAVAPRRIDLDGEVTVVRRLALLGKSCWSSGSTLGLATNYETALSQLERIACRFQKRVDDAREAHAAARRRLDEARGSLEEPWELAGKLADLRAELESLAVEEVPRPLAEPEPGLRALLVGQAGPERVHVTATHDGICEALGGEFEFSLSLPSVTGRPIDVTVATSVGTTVPARWSLHAPGTAATLPLRGSALVLAIDSRTGAVIDLPPEDEAAVERGIEPARAEGRRRAV